MEWRYPVCTALLGFGVFPYTDCTYRLSQDGTGWAVYSLPEKCTTAYRHPEIPHRSQRRMYLRVVNFPLAVSKGIEVAFAATCPQPAVTI